MSEDCPHCVYEKNEANCRGCFEGSNYRPKPATNADRIRSMTDEELAKLLDNTIVSCGGVMGGRNCMADCRKCWLDWLRQEVDDDNHDN